MYMRLTTLPTTSRIHPAPCFNREAAEISPYGQDHNQREPSRSGHPEAAVSSPRTVYCGFIPVRLHPGADPGRAGQEPKEATSGDGRNRARGCSGSQPYRLFEPKDLGAVRQLGFVARAGVYPNEVKIEPALRARGTVAGKRPDDHAGPSRVLQFD
jgi:hypothetical protein